VRYASSKNAFGICDRCGKRAYLRELVWDNDNDSQNLRVHINGCYDDRNPSLVLGKHVYDDPQSLKDARPDQYQGAVSIVTTSTSQAINASPSNVKFIATGPVTLTLPVGTILFQGWQTIVFNAGGSVTVAASAQDQIIKYGSSVAIPNDGRDHVIFYRGSNLFWCQ
jgi:hypothetical protein